MCSTVLGLNSGGIRLMEELAYTAPHLFLEGDMVQLNKELDDLATQRGISPYGEREIKLDSPLDSLNNLKRKGPWSDVHYAPLLHQAIADNPPEHMNKDWFWSSISCFVLSNYVSRRWDSGLRRSNPGKFVKRHWLWIGTQGRLWNASARLWWLAEYAQRASEFSIHSAETLLNAMADNRELYTRTMSRGFAVRNPAVIAAIYDVVLAGNTYLYKYNNVLQLLMSLKIKADTFDVLDYEELRQIVINSLPPRYETMSLFQ